MTRTSSNSNNSSTRRSSRPAALQKEPLARDQPTLTSYFTRSKSSSSRNLSKSILLSCTPEIIDHKQGVIVEGNDDNRTMAGMKSNHATPKQKAKGRRMSISPRSNGTSLKNKLSKLEHEITLESKSPNPSLELATESIARISESAIPKDVLVEKLIHGEQSGTVEIVGEELPEVEVESESITTRINELKRDALSADVSLQTWIVDHKTSIDLHVAVEQRAAEEVEESEESPPPLDDISAQPILMTRPVVPALLTPHALAVADKLGIPRNTLRLAIPQAISFLETLLSNIDNVICLALSRSQPAIFAKLVRPLELMLGKRVTSEHVSQINYLWREAYKTEACRVIHDGKRVQSFRFHLSHLSSHDQLLERRVQFRWNSIKFIDKEHQRHLQTLGFDPIDLEKLQAWHKNFDLESIVVPVGRAEAKEDDLVQQTPTSQSVIPSTPLKQQTMNGSTPSTLLERIKAKQLLQQQQQMLAKPKLHQEHVDHLLTLVDRLTVLYSTCNKTTLPLAQVQSRLNLSTLVERNGKDVISELCELVPEWIQVLHMDDVKKTGALLVKVDKSMPIRGVRDKISRLLQAKGGDGE